MKNFMFSLSEIGGQTPEVVVNTEETTDDENSNENNDEIDLKNLFLIFDSVLNLFILPVYYN